MKKTILGIDIGKQTLYFSDVHGKYEEKLYMMREPKDKQ